MKFLQFLRITHKRLLGKSPVYFQVVRNVSIICAIIVSLPEFFSYLDIDIPIAFEPVLTRAIAIASFVAAFVASLTVEDSSTIKNDK